MVATNSNGTLLLDPDLLLSSRAGPPQQDTVRSLQASGPIENTGELCALSLDGPLHFCGYGARQLGRTELSQCNIAPHRNEQ